MPDCRSTYFVVSPLRVPIPHIVWYIAHAHHTTLCGTLRMQHAFSYTNGRLAPKRQTQLPRFANTQSPEW